METVVCVCFFLGAFLVPDCSTYKTKKSGAQTFMASGGNCGLRHAKKDNCLCRILAGGLLETKCLLVLLSSELEKQLLTLTILCI